MRKQKPQRVLIAMSGGVDSSVAALLLKKQGYEVIGAFMKNWSDTKNSLDECTWKQDRKIAIKISEKLQIPLITLDFEEEYRKFVVDKMFKLYKQGITPNPDIDCNNKVKFPLLWKAAKQLKADKIATGHYAQIKKVKISKKNKNSNYRYELLRAKDESKDQSYFLYRLSQKDLKNSLFPVGKLSKKKVRKIAKKAGFPNYNRKGTVGICFIGKINLKKFLQKRIKPKKGKILNPKGEKIGEHDGIYYYTIGQKIGPKFGINIKKPNKPQGDTKKWYVAKKDKKTNTIIAAPEKHSLLYKKNITIQNPHWINEKPKTARYNARIRQIGELLLCKLEKKSGKYFVTLKKPIKGVSEGQAIVLYKRFSKECIGGGVINFN